MMRSRAITLIQPWASLVVAGVKPIENRKWLPPRTLDGIRLWIHAGKKVDRAACERHGLDHEQLPRSAVIGSIVVVGYVKQSRDPWFVGPVGWLLEDAHALARPFPCRGLQGIWFLPDEFSRGRRF